MNLMISESCSALLLTEKNDKMFNFQHVFSHYSISHHLKILKLADVIDYNIKYIYIYFYNIIMCELLTVIIFI